MRKLLLLCLAFYSISIHAQTLNQDIKPVECVDISYSSSVLFERYYNSNQLDSAASILQYWESKCGLREPIFRAKVLLSLREQNFTESLFPRGNKFQYIYEYIRREHLTKNYSFYYYDDNRAYFGFIPFNQEFDKFTHNAANQLIHLYDSNSLEYLLCEFYSSDNPDTIFSLIQDEKFAQTSLQNEYNEIINSYLDIPEMNFSFISGIWIPTGKLNKLGVHPEIGVKIGIKHKKMNYDFTMSVKFINSPHDYLARRNRNSSWEPTKEFSGGYIGLEVGRDLLAKKRHEIQLTGGIAYDGFTAIREDTINKLESASANSFNFNIGFAYRYYINPSFYLSLRAKYNIVDYTLNDKVNLTGHPITIQFIIGGLGNYMRKENLKRLHYKWRR